MRTRKVGKGFLNKLINKLPFELHVPGYQYCGPGTKLEKRLNRGDPGINGLDRACKDHDIEYSKYSDGTGRYNADKKLSEEAWNRVISKDATLGERATALAVTAAMKAKMKLSKIGSGLKMRKRSKIKNKNKKKTKKIKGNKKKTFKCLLNATKQVMKNNSSDLLLSTKAAVKTANTFNRRNSISRPRVIPIPKTGGVLPLIPIFAGLSALGALTSGVTSVVKAARDLKIARYELDEIKRHNGTIEAIAFGKRGSGLYLKPYKTGYGLYLSPYPKNH